MLRLFAGVPRVVARASRAASSNASAAGASKDDQPWLDPWKHALPPKVETSTSFEEVAIDWKEVEALLPRDVVPPVPHHDTYPTPSGWRPPKDPPPSLPYYVGRTRMHTFPLYLSRRRDLLNETTLDFDYVELVELKNVEGDVFACEAELRAYLEASLAHPVATHVDELKGRIRVKGADRSLLEQFLYEKGF